MRRHEQGCTKNPNRVCGMCQVRMENEGVAPAPPRDELVRVLDERGFEAMKKAANDCPACILSAIRTKNEQDDSGFWTVSGPEDGRQTWLFGEAKKEWWKQRSDFTEMKYAIEMF